jgi:hypothetical protein
MPNQLSVCHKCLGIQFIYTVMMDEKQWSIGYSSLEKQ